MSILFTPITIRGVTLKNRIVMSPMCQYSAVDGFTNDWHLVHQGTRAAGGTALIFTEATAVLPEGRITPGDTGLWDDRHIDGLERIVGFVHSMGALAGIQLAHAGRKASCAVPWNSGIQLDHNNGGWQTVGPDSIPFRPGDRPPESLTAEGIEKTVSGFRAAAVRALAAGYDVIEIHSAHGYLLHEFLSPLSNRRTDEYGGSFENRTRLLLRIVREVREVLPEEKPLFVRISATDWVEGGWSVDDSVKLAYLLKDSDVDLIDCSSGGNVYDAVIPAKAGYQVPFAEAVRKAGILTGAVGCITKAAQAGSVIAEGKADIVLLARELLRNPYFALRAAKELGVDVAWPVQYLRARL